MSVKPIPDGYSAVTPYLIANGAAEALDFYQEAFGASVVMRHEGPGGKIMHAEFQIGDSKLMIGEACPEMGVVAPQSNGGTSLFLYVYVDDVDATFARALEAGAKELRPVVDQFYGDRSGQLVDPFGHVWSIATHKEDVSADELQRRSEAFRKSRETAAV
jgi:PhnB protein